MRAESTHPLTNDTGTVWQPQHSFLTCDVGGGQIDRDRSAAGASAPRDLHASGISCCHVCSGNGCLVRRPSDAPARAIFCDAARAGDAHTLQASSGHKWSWSGRAYFHDGNSVEPRSQSSPPPSPAARSEAGACARGGFGELLLAAERVVRAAHWQYSETGGERFVLASSGRSPRCEEGDVSALKLWNAHATGQSADRRRAG